MHAFARWEQRHIAKVAALAEVLASDFNEVIIPFPLAAATTPVNMQT
jgi:hypothetical protein